MNAKNVSHIIRIWKLLNIFKFKFLGTIYALWDFSGGNFWSRRPKRDSPRLAFVQGPLLRYLCSCPVPHYLQLSLLLLLQSWPLVSARHPLSAISSGGFPSIFIYFSAFSSFSVHFLLSGSQTREVHFEIYVHTNWKRREEGLELELKERRVFWQDKKKGKLGCIARIAVSVKRTRGKKKNNKRYAFKWHLPGAVKFL